MARAGAFQRHKVRSAALPASLRSCCSSPPPGRTQQAVRLGLLCGGFAGFAGVFPLTSQHCVVASAQDEGKGEEARVAPSSRSPTASWATPGAHSAPLPRAAGCSIRPLRGEVACLLPCVTSCVVAAVRRVRGGGGENETKHAREQTDDFSAQRPGRTACCARQGAESGRRASPRWCRRSRWWCRPRLPSPLPSSCAPATTRR